MRRALLLIMFLAPFALGKSTDFLEHEIQVHDPVDPALLQGPLQVIVDINGGDEIKGLSGQLLSQTIVKDVKRNGIEAISFHGNYAAAFETKALSLGEILAPKIWLDVSLKKIGYGYTIQSNFSYIRYEAISPRKFLAKVWSRPQLATSVAERDAVALLSQFIERETKELAKLATSQKKVARRTVAPPTKASYSYRWTDPKANRPAIHMGVTMGTPALGNLYLGLANPARIPILISVSGMYWSVEKRGVQAELSYLIAQDGRLKHAAGLALVGVNETSEKTSPVVNSRGTPFQDQTNTTDRIRFYVGPAYTLMWKDLRLETGVGLRTVSDSNSPARFLIQVGYTPGF